MAEDLIDAAALRVEFQRSNAEASQKALWQDPTENPRRCRYCGKSRQWLGKLDGHVACVVTDDFKLRVGELLRSPHVTYRKMAEAIGVPIGAITSWAVSAGVSGPLTHPRRIRRDLAGGSGAL